MISRPADLLRRVQPVAFFGPTEPARPRWHEKILPRLVPTRIRPEDAFVPTFHRDNRLDGGPVPVAGDREQLFRIIRASCRAWQNQPAEENAEPTQPPFDHCPLVVREHEVPMYRLVQCHA